MSSDLQSLIKEMNFHREKYTELAEEVKAIRSEADVENLRKKNKDSFDSLKGKYNWFVDGTKIDWDEVEKLILSNEERIGPSGKAENYGHFVGYDVLGYPGLGASYSGNVVSWVPMVEDESDIAKFQKLHERSKHKNWLKLEKLPTEQ